jgi:hypothetical protein
MSSTVDQSKGSAPSLSGPLDGSHDALEWLLKNWDSIYNGGGGGMTQSSGGALNFGDCSITFCDPLYIIAGPPLYCGICDLLSLNALHPNRKILHVDQIGVFLLNAFNLAMRFCYLKNPAPVGTRAPISS